MWRAPNWVFELCLLVRDDEWIGFQEMEGAILGQLSFADWIEHEAATYWQGNMDVLYTLLRGGGRSPELNSLAGRLWLQAAQSDTAVRVGRTESRANLADGPSRLDTTLMKGLAGSSHVFRRG